MPGLITQAEYARRRGVSREAVRKAVIQGRISLLRGKIDPKRADREWSQSTLTRVGRPAKAGRTGAHTSRRPADAASKGGQNGYADARAARERVLAELAELDLKVRKGTLVNADQAREKVFKAARAARDLVLGLPERLAPRLVGQDEAAIRRILTDETGRICDVIANAPNL